MELSVIELQQTVLQLQEEIRKRQAVEKELALRLSYFDAFFSSVNMGFVLFDNQFRYIKINSALAEINGVPVADHQGKSLKEVLPELAPTLEPILQQVLETGEAILDREVQGETFASPGVERYWLASYYPLFGETDSKPFGAAVAVVETTQQKQTEVAIREQEQFLRSIYDGVEHPVFVVDVEANGKTRYVGWNATTERLSEVSSDSVAGKTPEEVFGESEGAAIKQTFQRCLEAGVSTTYEECLTFQGQQSWWLTTLNPIEDSQGRIYRIVGTSINITEQQAALRERKQAEITLSRQFTAIEATSEGIAIADASGKFTYLNQAHIKLFGYNQAEELLGQSWQILYTTEEISKIESEVFPRLGQQGKWQGEVRAKRQDGSFFLEELSLTLLDDGELVCVCRDISDRAASEAALRVSEERFRSLVEATSQIIWNVEPDGKIVTEQPQWSAFTGQAFEEFKDWGWLEVLHPSDRFQAAEIWSTAITNKSLYESEYRLRRYDGEYRYMSIRGVPLLNEDGSIREWIGALADITERKQAETQLAEQQQTLRTILDHAPIWVWMLGTDGRMQVVNRTFCENVGIPESRFLDVSHYSEILPPEVSVNYMASDRECFAQDTPHFSEETIPFVDGKLHDLEIIKAKVMNESGAVLGLIGLGVDATHRKQVEAQLRAKAKYEQLLNQLTRQIRRSLDIDQILETVVREIRDLLQIDRCVFLWYRTIGEAPYWEIVQSASRPNLPSFLGVRTPGAPILPVTKMLLSRELIRLEDIPNEPDPIKRKLFRSYGCTAVLALPIHTQSGQIGAISCHQVLSSRSWNDEEVELLRAIADNLAIAIDQAQLLNQSRLATAQAQAHLQNLQRTQSQLVQSEKMSSLGQLVAGVAHEINNPVNFIYNNLTHANDYTQDLLRLVELYKQHYPTPHEEIQEEAEAIDLDFLVEDLPKLLTSMKVGADRIQNIVRSLRNFSRMDEAEMKAVNIHEGIDSTLLILQNRLKDKPDRPGIEVLKNYDNLPLIECYAGQLNQVFMNIISNAIDALDERDQNRTLLEAKQDPSRIKIDTEKLGEEKVRIRITDNGIGIPEDVQKHLFNPFFTTKPIGKGTGLGMSISYEIITEKHGGSLFCNSKLGQGVEFIIEIPLKQRDRVAYRR